jgi:hypothetical protein
MTNPQIVAAGNISHPYRIQQIHNTSSNNLIGKAYPYFNLNHRHRSGWITRYFKLPTGENLQI